MSDPLTSGLIIVVHRFDDCNHWISIWCMNAGWTQEMNCFSIAARCIKDTFLHEVMLNIVERISMCIQADDSRFEHILNQTVQSFSNT